MVDHVTNNKLKNLCYLVLMILVGLIPLVSLSLVGGRDCDYLWHTILFRYMRDNHSLFTQDIFSWRAAEMGYSEIAHSWLGSYIIGFIVDSVVNFGIIEYFASYVVLIPFYIIACLLIYHYFYKLSHKNVDLFFFLICCMVSFLFTNPRPQNISHCLFIWGIGICFKLRQDPKSKQYMFLPTISIIWANMHGGSIVLYFAILFGFTFMALFSDKQFGRFDFSCIELKKYDLFKKMSIVSIISVLASLINPYGYKLFLYFLHVSDDNFSQLYVREWQAIESTDVVGLLILTMLLLPVFVDFKLDGIKYLFTFGCLTMCLKYVRFEHYAVIFAIILFIYYYDCYCDWQIKIKDIKASQVTTKPNFLESKRNRVFVGLGLCGVVVLTVVLCIMTIKMSILNVSDDATVVSSVDVQPSSISTENLIGYYDVNVEPNDNDVLSDDLVNYLKDLKLKGLSDRLFCSYDTGAKLIYSGIPSFIDSRADLFVGGELTDSMTLLMMQGYAEDMDSLIDKYGFDSFIIEKSACFGFQEYLLSTGNWILDYSDNDFNVYIKTHKNID